MSEPWYITRSNLTQHFKWIVHAGRASISGEDRNEGGVLLSIQESDGTEHHLALGPNAATRVAGELSRAAKDAQEEPDRE